MSLIKFNAPMYIELGKKKPKKIPMNMNWYRNAHFRTNAAVKKLFKEQLRLDFYQITAPVKITYTFYYQSNRRQDIGNSLAVVSKFTEDALVDFGVLKDDDYNNVVKVVGIFGGIDKDNPRCEVVVEEV